MLIVIPVSRSDAKLIDATEKAFQKFSPGSNHNLLVVSSPNARDAAQLLLNKLQPLFINSALETFVSDNNLDWPRACNFYFQQTTYLIPKYAKPNQGWLWYEMDTIPATQNWLTIIEQEYYNDNILAAQEHRKPLRYMGTRERTIKSFAGEITDGGSHMASVAVYPADIGVACPVLKSIASINVHFSVHIKWYPLKSFLESPLFQNNRDTINYRVEDGKIVCDSIARNAFDVHFNEPISDSVILIHGCKDNSLIDLLPTDRKVNVVVRQAVVPAAPVAPPKPVIPPSSPFAFEGPKPQQQAPAEESTQVVHQKLAPPQVRKFGEHLVTGANRPAAKFDDSGLLIEPPIPAAPLPEPVLPPPVIVEQAFPEITPATEPPVAVKTPPKRGRKGKKTRTWTAEQRQAAADRMRKMQQEKKLVQNPEPVAV